MNNYKFTGIIVVVLVFILFGSCAFPLLTTDTATFTVTDKERVVKKDGDSVNSKYFVFTETETFENTDCFILFKFNSSDLQGKLRRGQTYHAKVYGWRVPFLSWYRNIVSVE